MSMRRCIIPRAQNRITVASVAITIKSTHIIQSDLLLSTGLVEGTGHFAITDMGISTPPPILGDALRNEVEL